MLIGQAAAARPSTAPSRTSTSLFFLGVDQTGALAYSSSGNGTPVEANVVMTVFEGSGANAFTLCAYLNRRFGLRFVLNLGP